MQVFGPVKLEPDSTFNKLFLVFKWLSKRLGSYLVGMKIGSWWIRLKMPLLETVRIENAIHIKIQCVPLSGVAEKRSCSSEGFFFISQKISFLLARSTSISKAKIHSMSRQCLLKDLYTVYSFIYSFWVTVLCWSGCLWIQSQSHKHWAWGQLGWDASPWQCIMRTHLHTYTPRGNFKSPVHQQSCFWEETKETHADTESYLSSWLDWGLWSCDCTVSQSERL